MATGTGRPSVRRCKLLRRGPAASRANRRPAGSGARVPVGSRPADGGAATAHAGDAVNANAPLAELSDYTTLYIEGRAFERDAPAVTAPPARNGG